MFGKIVEFAKQNREQVIIAVLAALVLVIYWQATGFQFINFDDNIYVYENSRVAGGLNKDNLIWAFTEFHSANWHPLTWISHQLDVSMFGLNSGSHHATNVLFHVINTILAFTVFLKLTKSTWKSAMVAALFAIHPAHVESVAWVAERKDVLSTMFWLLTMWSYCAFTKKIKAGESSRIEYLLTITFFALGLMAKPMLVTLPFVLLLLDFWPLERLKSIRTIPRLIVEKIPFFALTIASSIITVMAQRSGGAVQSLEMLPFGLRVSNAVVAYVKYIATFVYPANLSAWYPYQKNFPSLQILGATVFLIAVTALCVIQIKKRRYLLFGWLWFLGTLVPVIGLVQVGVQSMADRYTYIPFFGLFVMTVWLVDDLFRKQKKFLAAGAILIIVALSAASFRQTSLWKTEDTLYRHSIDVTKGNFLIMQNYCHSLILQEQLDEAEKQCRDSIESNPRYAEAYNSLGIIQIKREKFADAEQSFRKSIENRPDFGMFRVNLAVALANLGKTSEAEDNLRTAAETIPHQVQTLIWIDAIAGLARAYAAEKNYEKASENFARALGIAPERNDLRANLALTLLTQKKFDQAQKQIEIALNNDPKLAEAHNILGLILFEKGKREDSILEFQKALELKPELTEAKQNLEKAINGEK